MNALVLLAGIAALGVQWGWERVPGGGIEYIIRIEPHALDSLGDGRDIFSDLPPQIGRIRSYRITVSDRPVANEGQPPPAEAAAPSTTTAQRAPDVPEGAVMAPGGGTAPAPPTFEPLPPDPTATEGPSLVAPATQQPSIPPAYPRTDVPTWRAEPPIQQPTRSTASGSFGPQSETDPNRQPRLAQPSWPPTAAAARAATAPRSSDLFSQPALPGVVQTSPSGVRPHAFSSEHKSATPASSGTSGRPAASNSAEPSKPWNVLLATFVGLFASCGLNLYLAIITWDQRQRYRAVVSQLKAETQAAGAAVSAISQPLSM